MKTERPLPGLSILLPLLAFAALTPLAARGDSSAATSSWLPAVHIVGASGVFRTDVQIFNPDPTRYAPVRLYFTPAGADGTTLPGWELSPALSPRESITLEDVVVNYLGFSSGFGLLEVRSGDTTPLIVTSNLYNVSGEKPGTYGQFSPGQPYRKSVGFDESVFGDLYIVGLKNDPVFRTNVALMNPSAAELEAGLQVVDAGGQVWASRAYLVPPFSIRQINDLFEKEFPAAGIPRGGPYRLTVFVNLSNEARVLCYASVIDLRTGDPYLIPGEPTIAP
jgi:hypothetical protein